MLFTEQQRRCETPFWTQPALGHLQRRLHDRRFSGDSFGVRLIAALSLDQIYQFTCEIDVGIFQSGACDVQRSGFRLAVTAIPDA